MLILERLIVSDLAWPSCIWNVLLFVLKIHQVFSIGHITIIFSSSRKFLPSLIYENLSSNKNFGLIIILGNPLNPFPNMWNVKSRLILIQDIAPSENYVDYIIDLDGVHGSYIWNNT